MGNIFIFWLDKINMDEQMVSDYNQLFHNNNLETSERDPLLIIAMIIEKVRNNCWDFSPKFKEGHLYTIRIQTSSVNFAEFSTILDALSHFSMLQELTITDCHGQDLGPLLTHFTHLTSLSLSHGTISDWTGLLGNSSLQKLSLDDMGLKMEKIPDELFQLPLIELRLSHNPLLITLPESFGNLSVLQILKVPDNPALVSLPKSIGSLKKLGHLEATNCALHTLPDSIGGCTGLKVLYLKGCPIYTFPKSMENVELIGLSLDSPFLSVLPPSLRIPDHEEATYLIDIDGVPFRSLSGIPFERLSYIDIKTFVTRYLHPYANDLLNQNAWKDLVAYYLKHPITLAQQCAQDPNSLTAEEIYRLKWEGGVQERTILDHAKNYSDHPVLKSILQAITNRLQVGPLSEILGDKNGFNAQTRTLHGKKLKWAINHAYPEVLHDCSLHPRAVKWLKAWEIQKLDAYYLKSPEDLAQQMLSNVPSLTDYELERLAWESTEVELSLLEKSPMLVDHPVVAAIRARLKEMMDLQESPTILL